MALSQVEEKHAAFLEEESSLQSQHDSNATTIASLRKELAKVKQALEEAHHVDEDEAEAYLALLSSQGGEDLDADEKSVVSDVEVDPNSPPQPPSTATRSGENLSSSAPLPRRASNDPPARPPRRPRPTSLVAGHPFQTTSPYPPNFLGTSPTPHGEGAPQVSPIQLDDAGFVVHPAHSVYPELARDGGRWSKVFPSLKRKTSLTKRV
jgi:hypothetical protein